MFVPRGSRVWICGAVFETLNDVTVEGAGAKGHDTYASYMEKYDTPFDGLAIAKMLQQADVDYAVTGPNGEVLTNQRA